MGQKVHPTSLRLGSTFTWSSRWFAEREEYSDLILEDKKLRGYFATKLANAGLVRVEIERSLTSIKLILHVARPGVVIGRGGANLETIKKDVERLLNIAKL
jgi:small subunit ribosomal protein S3